MLYLQVEIPRGCIWHTQNDGTGQYTACPGGEHGQGKASFSREHQLEKGSGGVPGKETGLGGDTPFLSTRQTEPGCPTWRTDQENWPGTRAALEQRGWALA